MEACSAEVICNLMVATACDTTKRKKRPIQGWTVRGGTYASRDIGIDRRIRYDANSTPSCRLVSVPRNHDRILRLHALWTDGANRLRKVVFSAVRSNNRTNCCARHLCSRLLRSAARRIGI